MADIQSNLRINVDTGNALAQIKSLQRQISAFHDSLRNSGNAANQAISNNLSKNLLNSVNSTQKFSASLTTVNDASQSFTSALERNKLSMGQYFKFAGGSTKTFGKLFKNEFNTIETVARERVKTLQTQYIRMGRDANGALEAIKVRPLRLDMQNLGTQVAMTAQKQQLFNQLMKQGSTNLLNFGKNTQWAGRQLMVGFTIPLALMGSMAIKEFRKIEEQAVKFRRVYGGMFNSSSETEKALQNVRELANEFTKYGIAVEKTIDLAAKVAQMGNAGAALEQQVVQATRLSVLGGMEQMDALDTTISLTNAFGIEVEDLANKINFLNAAENQTILSIEDFNTAIPLSGSVVKQLGGDVEDLAVLLTAMREGGINASQAGNALKSSLGRLIAPSRNAKETLGSFGIDVLGIVNENAGNLMGTIDTLAYALNALDPLSRARSIEALFGKFQFARMSTLFSNIVRDGSQASKILKLTTASAAELQVVANRELKAVEESPAFKLQKQIEQLQASLAPLGAEFIKVLSPLIDFGIKVLKSFNNMDDGAKAFVTNVITALGLIAPVALMSFGLIANGIANFIKGANFVRILFGKLAGAGTGLNQMTTYMTQEQLEATASATSLGHAHSQLTSTFTSEKIALDGLINSYRNATSAMSAFSGVSAQSRIRPGAAPTQTKKYASGVLSVPGPKGKGDVVPAMLSPGEAVIPAKQADKYRGFIQQMISGGVPGFFKGGFIGMPKSSKSVIKDREAGKEIFQNVANSKYKNVAPTEYGHQLAKTTGHSFPIFGLGGVYLSPSGKKVFVKPVRDEKSALAEQRGTQIARMAHDLKAPEQRIVVMRDPTDMKRKRKFLALESDLNPQFVNNDEKAVFNKEQYFRQLTASLLRADKDLAAGNMFGDVVADVGPAGVFSRASGVRDYSSDLPSMEDQATVNLLGVKGGAKRAFAESTVGLMGDMGGQQYHQNMLREIQRVLPKLRQTVASFGLTDTKDIDVYNGMIRRLEEGLNVDWSRFHTMHSAVKVSKPRQTTKPMPAYSDGVLSVPGPKGKGDVIPAMLSPGEAVIPAKKAQKYRGFIQQMISGNIPGFRGGTPGLGIDVGEKKFNLNTTASAAAIIQKEASTFAATGQDAARVVSQTLSLIEKSVKTGLGDFRSKLAIINEAETGMGPKPTLARAGNEKAAEKVQGKPGSIPSIPKQVANDPNLKRPFDLASGQAQGQYEHAVSKGISPKKAIDITGYDPNDPSKTGVEQSHRGKMGAMKSDPLAWATGATDLDSRMENNQIDVMSRGGEDGRQMQIFEAAAKSLGLNITSLRDTILQNSALSESERSQFAAVTKEVSTNPELSAGKFRTKADENSYMMKNQMLDAGYENVDIQNQTDYRAYVDERDPAFAAVDQRKSEIVNSSRRALEEKDPELAQKAFNVGDEIGTNLVAGAKQGADEEGDMRSPSREMFERGKNLVRGILDGVQEGYRESSGETLPTSSVPKPPSIPGLDAPKPPPIVNQDKARGASIGKKFFKKTEGFLENQIMGDGAFGKTAMGTNLREAFDANNGIGPVEDIGGETQLDRSKRELLAQQQSVQAVNAAQLNQEKSINIEDGILNDEEAINIRNEDGSLKTRRQIIQEEKDLQNKKAMNQRQQNREDRKLIAQDRAQKRQSRAGKALGVLGTASMVAGMASGVEGKVGEIAQKIMPALFALSAIAPILMALSLPLAALALIIGGVAFGLYKWNEMIEKSRKEGEALGNALTLSTDKLIAFAESTGKVSATEERRATEVNQLSGESEKTRKFGMTFLQSDGGKGLLSDIGTMTSSGMGKQESAEASGRQLAMMMAQGLISSGEAYSIAAAIGTELNDYNFSASLVGSLVELTGPNGEDLTKDPLKVMVAIQEESMSSVSDFAALAADQETLANDVKDKISEKRIKARTERDLRYAQGGLDSIAAGYEGFIADASKILSLSPFSTLNPQDLYSDEVVGNNDLEFIIEKNKESAKLQSASIQVGVNQIQQNQQLLDSLTKQYSTQIKQKEEQVAQTKDAEKKLALEKDLEALYAKRDSDLATLNARNATSMDQIVAMKDTLDPKVFDEAIKASVLSQFEDDDPMKILAENAVKNLNALENSSFKTQIQLQFASGELSMDGVQKLLDIVDKNPRIKYRFDAIVDMKGAAQGGQLLDLLVKTGMSEDGISRQIDIFAGISSTEDFDQRMEALAQVANMATEYGFKVNLETTDNKNTLEDVTRMVNLIKDMPDTVTQEFLVEFNKDLKDPDLQAIIDNWDTIFGVGMTGSAQVLVDFVATGDFDSISRYFDSLGLDAQSRAAYGKSMAMSPGFEQEIRAKAAANDVANRLNKTEEGKTPKKDPSGNKADPVENILNKLKQLRNHTIDATGGFKELLRVLGGNKEITVFRGMDQLSLGAKFGKEFAGYLSGLDEDTRKLFVEFKKGGPILTEIGQAMRKAFADVAIGEFQINLVESMTALLNQRTAMETLTKKGVEYADALKLATNETIALAIASGELSGGELDELISKVKEFRKESEISSVIDDVNKAINDFVDDLSVRRKINLNYSDLQEQAILNDGTLRAMVKLGQAGSDAFKTRLQQIMSSPDFLNDVFSRGFSNVQEAFRVQEEQLAKSFENALKSGTLADFSFAEKFGIDELAAMIGMTEQQIKDLMDIDGPVSIIEIAEQQIATLNYEMDDFQAQLDEISLKEEKINSKYEERLSALDKTLKINKENAAIQKSQLSLASALSTGDIAAAAKAAQELRQQQADAREVSQKNTLEKSREQELAAIVSSNLLTREEIETRVKDIQRKIADIEESRLEPAQRLLELSGLLESKQLDYQTVLNKTKEAWDNIKLSVDAANITGKDFIDTMNAAIAAAAALPGAIAAQNDALGGAGEPRPANSTEAAAAPEAIKPRINSSYTVAAEAQAAGNTRAAVIDRDTAKTAAIAAVRDGGLSVGNTTIKASSTLNFAEQVQAIVLSNREAFANSTSASQKSALQKENVRLMQASGLRFAAGGAVPGDMGGGKIRRFAAGGGVKYYPMGGLIPYKAQGGLFQSINTDTVPAMLTPGEFVVRRSAVDGFGVNNLKSINNGTYAGESVYNYSVNVNVKSDSNPDQIARSVMNQIKQVDSMRLRGSRF